MRMARIKIRGRSAVYHCISRIVGGQALLEDYCKEKLRLLMWQQARFCGLQIITYCIMGNHLHLLVRVPERQEVDDQELLQRAQCLYSSQSLLVAQLVQDMRQNGAIGQNLREGLTGRMGDLSGFMKELKQRFSRWYNKQNGRFGTLWAERFTSLVVEDQPGPVGSVAAYVDLNPVRAGLVQDPKDYRFCGYAEALAGGKSAREGLLSFLRSRTWSKGGGEYRQKLFVTGGKVGQSGKVRLDSQEILRVLREGGQIHPAEALRLRIRYFSAGVVLGSEAYVNEVFAEFRDRFGAQRKSGARRLGQLPFPSLRTLRDLKVAPCG